MTRETRPIVVEETYAVGAAVLWRAITETEAMRQWFFEPLESFRPEVGFETKFVVQSQGKDWLHLWKVREVVPFQRLAYTFNYAGYEGDALVTWVLSECPGSTKLTLTHTGIETFPQDEPAFAREMGVAGWTYFLTDSLKKFLELDS